MMSQLATALPNALATSRGYNESETLSNLRNPEIRSWAESMMREMTEVNAQKRVALSEKYGVEVSDEEFSALYEADRALAYCQGCMYQIGACNNFSAKDKFWTPTIKVVAGKVVLGKERCPGWKFHINEQCDRAGVPKRYIGKTLSDYRQTEENADAIAMAHWYIEEYPKDTGLYFYGGVGTGKTLLAAIITRELICAGHKVIFGDAPTLLKNIKERFDYGAFARYEDGMTSQMVLDKYMNVEVLVLDDLGTEQPTEWSVGTLYQIINTRYNEGRRTIVTSNYDLEGLSKRLTCLGTKLQASRIASRLMETCEEGYFGTRDRRRERRYA